MKCLLILAAAFAVANAGVRTLGAYEEEQVLQQFYQLCSGGRGDGTNGVYCKISPDTNSETQHHEIQVHGKQEDSSQTVYIQPPSTRTNHQIRITGSSGSNSETKIYVLPSQNQHSIQHTYEHNGSNKQQKPTVYFLKGGNGGGDDGGYNAPSVSRTPQRTSPTFVVTPSRQYGL